MANIVSCPTCGAQYDATGYEPGMQFACTSCGSMVTINDPQLDFAPESVDNYNPGEVIAERARKDAKVHASGRPQKGAGQGRSRKPAGKAGGSRQPGQRPKQGRPQQGRPKQGQGQKSASRQGGARPARGGQTRPGTRPTRGRPEPSRGPHRGPRKSSESGRGALARVGKKKTASGRIVRVRNEYPDDEYDDYYQDEPNNKKTIIIVSSIVGAVILLVIIILLSSGNNPAPIPEADEPEKEIPTEKPKPWDAILNAQSVKQFFDNYFRAIEAEDQATFIGLFNLEELGKVHNKTADYFREFLDVTEMKKALAYYSRTLNPAYDKYYYKAMGGNQFEVGYGAYVMQPLITGVGQTFDMVLKLKVDETSQSWKIVEASWPAEYKKIHVVPVTLENGEIWRYDLPPEEFVKWRNDSTYVPPDKYKTKRLQSADDLTRGDEMAEELEKLDIPDEITNISLTSEEEDMIDAVSKGYVQSSRDFGPEHLNRNVAGALLNIILSGVKNSKLGDKDDLEAAKEANKALQYIFEKDSGRDRFEYQLKLGGMSSDEQAVETAHVIKKWIDLFKSKGWSV